jgi:very-short-patch-repair endonuclease
MRVKGDKEKARKLRRTMTLPEMLLWRELRKRPNGLQYRRQHPAGPYVLDFFCAPANLAVEVDGEAHNRGNMPLKDEARDKWLESRGIRVMRVPANEVLRNLDGVLQFIAAAADDR